MNINFPSAAVGDICGVKIAKQGNLDVTWTVHKKLDPVNDPYYWLHATYPPENKDKSSDVALLECKKHITITALRSRHEYTGCVDKLEELFASNV
jgi:broad specificity polyphosphatase/5'/3'-nucleotidase SurE